MPVNKDFYTLAGSSGQSTGYEIEQSIRFNQTDNASMSRTPSSASSRTTWTFSWWWKRGILSGSTNGTNQRQPIFGTTDFSILSNHNSTQIDGINVVYTGSANDIQTSEKYRDVSAWYHFVFVLDTTNDIPTERVRLYKNGERVTSFASITYPSKDTTYTVNNTQAHYIGLRNSGENLDGYLAEMHFLDGYAYGPEYFGEFDDYGIWRPIQYTGSYGTNGFFIDGRDSSDLGDDESGNGNDFTTSNLVATDKRTDSPTNNHATWNPLVNATPAYANGNIDVAFAPASSTKWAKAVMNFTLPNTGTWYWEGQEFNNVINPATALGIVDSNVERLDDKGLYNRPFENMSTFTGIKVYSGPGQSLATYEAKNGSTTSTSGAAILSTSRLGFLWEPENNRLTIYDDGSQYQQFTSINAGNYVFVVGQETGTNLYFRLFVDANDWTQTPTGISSSNALTSKNIGS